MLDTDKINEEMNKLIAERKFDAIAERAEQMIEEYTDSYLGRWWKARAQTFLGDTGAALRWFMEAMKKAKNEDEESKISSSMANIYNIRKDWNQSLNYTEIALELNPDNVVAVLARSIALVATGNRKDAYQLLEEKKGLFNDEYQRACRASVMKDKERVLEHLAKALKDDPHHRVTVLYDPDFEPYRRDPELRGLLKV